MRILVSIVCLCTLGFCLGSFRSSSVALTAPSPPTLELRCSFKGRGIGRRPPSSVTFAWRVTNAHYVLIKGYDQGRHPLIGEFDRPSGGAFTFIAVNGDEIVRKAWMCLPKYQQMDGPDWTMAQDESVFSSHSQGSNIELTTTLSKDQFKDVLINLARENYGVVLEAEPALKGNIFLVTKSYGAPEALCQSDGCRKDGSPLSRQLGFDIVAQRESQEGDKLRYAIHVTGEILSKPAAGNGEWGLDSNSEEIAAVMSKKLVKDIMNFKSRER